jgi:hypothetical protein
MLESRRLLAADMPVDSVDPSGDRPIDWQGDYSAAVGDYNGDGAVDHGDYQEWKAAFGTPRSAAGGSDGVVDAAAYVVWRHNLGTSTRSSDASQSQEVSSDGSNELADRVSFGGDADDRPTEEVSFGGDADDCPTEQVSLNSNDDGDANAESPVDVVMVDHQPYPAADTSIADETPVDTDAIDQALELDDDVAAGDLGTNSPTDTLEGSEGEPGGASVDPQPSADAGLDGLPVGLLDAATREETTGPDDSGVEFGVIDWVKELLGPDYDDVETRDDFDKIRRTKYDKYEVEREINKLSHEEACKKIDIDADGSLAKAFKRVYENQK